MPRRPAEAKSQTFTDVAIWFAQLEFYGYASAPSPHFSPAFYCGGGSGHVNCVALCRAPRHTVEYACGVLGRLHSYTWRFAPSTIDHLRRLATKSGEKCGLVW
jgi:hypothetical protein